MTRGGPLRAVPDAGGRLRDIATELERSGWAFELLDGGWRAVHFSEQLRLALGGARDEELGLGLTILETRALPAWQGCITDESQCEWEAQHAALLDAREAAPPAWTFTVDWRQPDGTPTRINGLGLALREEGGTVGYALFYGPSLPASLLALVVRGDVGLWERMARLVEPRRTEAAIVFADLEASAALARRLPSRAFFDFIRAFTSAMDEAVIGRRGIVGKHAGDGVTAFFLADELGGAAAAAEAAIDAVRAMARAADAAAASVPAVGRALEGAEGAGLNAGLHWGAGLYMGQLVTGGRLEVTALGDEVNECARIEQSAHAGALLASKALLERLDDAGAARLGIDPGGVVYRTVADLPGAGSKAVRDAGGIPVAEI